MTVRNGTATSGTGLSPRKRHPVLALRDAVSALCGADYELACAASALEEAEHPAAAEAEALFQTALAFRQKLEAEEASRNGR